MNFKMMRYITGQLLLAEGALMALPFAVSLIYGEFSSLWAFIIPMAALFILGALMVVFKPADKTLGVKEGFVTVGLSWIVLSLFGALPFVISGLIPNYIDAFFETVSGFTTTGASVLDGTAFGKLWHPELSPESAMMGMRGVFFWRSFTNWIGGMGVLVFVLAVMPQQDMKSSRLVHVMRAEMPGPKVDKIVPTIKKTAAIMYGIYIVMTLACTAFLLFGGMDLYEALTTSFSTAGTGGFAIWSDSMTSFYGTVAHPEFCVWVLSIFMLLFAINFNLYYLILTGKALSALFSEELRWFSGFVAAATALVAFDTYDKFGNIADTIRHSLFQVSSVISTTGFATDDFNLWGNLAKTTLLIIMFIGACAGSTGGGIKVSRLVIALKSTAEEVRHMVHPRRVKTVHFEGKAVDKETQRGAFAFIITYAFIFFASFLLVAIFDGRSIETTFSAIAACINNIGPGLSDVGPASNYASLSYASKIILSFDMLFGRLEIFPMLLVFSPAVWFKK